MLHPDLEAIIPYLHTRNRDRLHPTDASQTNTSTEYSLPLANSPSTQPALSRTPHTNTHTPPLSRLPPRPHHHAPTHHLFLHPRPVHFPRRRHRVGYYNRIEPDADPRVDAVPS